MKNVINYFYGIVVNDFTKRDNNFIFYIGKNRFEFIQFYGERNQLLNTYYSLKNYNRDCDEIIFNKNNDLLTTFQNIPYILLKKTNINTDIIDVDDIINYDCNIYFNEKLDWKKLWINKLDYYEMQLKEVELKYPLLNESFSYYFGMSEIAINLLNYVNYKNIDNCIAHKRLEIKSDLYNPLNVIFDSKTRDLAEFIKANFFKDKISNEFVIEILNKVNLSKDEMLLFLSRLIYPSYYFDLYEKIYNGKEDEKTLNKIIKKNALYEAFLKNLYNYIKPWYRIPQIEFLEY